MTHFIGIFTLLWQSGIEPSVSSRWACISFKHFYFSLFNFSNCSGGQEDSKCLLWAFLDPRGCEQTALLLLPAAEFLLRIKGGGSDSVPLLPSRTLTEISGPGQSLWRPKGRHEASREEALELWRAGVGRSSRHPGFQCHSESLSWSSVYSLFPHFSRNSLSLLNSLMNLFLFRLNGVDIPVTEPNFFNMKILTRSRLWGKRMLYAFICFFLNNRQQPKRQKQTHEQKDLCSLPQISLSLWKMNEIRNTPVHISMSRVPWAGTPWSFWTWGFYYITAATTEEKICKKYYLCVNNYRATTW